MLYLDDEGVGGIDQVSEEDPGGARADGLERYSC